MAFNFTRKPAKPNTETEQKGTEVVKKQVPPAVVKEVGQVRVGVKVDVKSKIQLKIPVSEAEQAQAMQVVIPNTIENLEARAELAKQSIATRAADTIPTNTPLVIEPDTLFSDDMQGGPGMLRNRLQQLEGYLQDEGVPIADMKQGLASVRNMLKATPELAAELLEEDIGLITRSAIALTGQKILEKKAPKKKSATKKSYAKITSAGLDDDDLAMI